MLSLYVEGLITLMKEEHMNDEQIIDLFFARSEKAILEVKEKYGNCNRRYFTP